MCILAGYLVSEILVGKKTEVIDTKYPCYGSTVLHKKTISRSVYPPLVKYGLQWIIKDRV